MIEYPRQTELPESYLKARFGEFLLEDAPDGDITSNGTIGEGEESEAYIQAEEDLVFAGAPIIRAAFDGICEVEMKTVDGELVANGDIITEISGPAREILLRERVLLNLLQRLSGIATLTRRYVEKAAPHGCKVLDTRKTTPGLRLFEKYAVAAGGGHNHRLDLSSGILIKDNHIKAAGGLFEAVEKIRKSNDYLPVELEVENITQLKAGIEAGVDGFLLDNMPPEEVEFAVNLLQRYAGGEKIFLEASGGINLDTIESYAKTGVNAVSVGALTHSVKSADIHIEFI